MTRPAVTPPRAAYFAAHGKPRACLRCHNMFDSEGPGNRVCKPCTTANKNVGTPAQRVRATLPDPPDEDDDWR